MSAIAHNHHVRRDYGHSEIVQNEFAEALKAVPELRVTHFVCGTSNFFCR